MTASLSNLNKIIVLYKERHTLFLSYFLNILKILLLLTMYFYKNLKTIISIEFQFGEMLSTLQVLFAVVLNGMLLLSIRNTPDKQDKGKVKWTFRLEMIQFKRKIYNGHLRKFLADGKLVKVGGSRLTEVKSDWIKFNTYRQCIKGDRGSIAIWSAEK